jgi:hypothetical protein
MGRASHTSSPGPLVWKQMSSKAHVSLWRYSAFSRLCLPLCIYHSLQYLSDFAVPPLAFAALRSPFPMRVSFKRHSNVIQTCVIQTCVIQTCVIQTCVIQTGVSFKRVSFKRVSFKRVSFKRVSFKRVSNVCQTSFNVHAARDRCHFMFSKKSRSDLSVRAPLHAYFYSHRAFWVHRLSTDS